MRFGSVGLAELLLLGLLVVLFWRGRQLSSLGQRLGEKARKPFRQARWLWSSMAGDGAEALRAEEAFGRECARELAAQFPASVAPEDERRVAEIGARLTAAQGESPRGFVFVTDAMLRLCAEDPDAAAFVVAHEMGHVLRRHARDRLMADLVFDAVGRRLPAARQVARELMQKSHSRGHEFEADAEAVRLMAAAGFDPDGGVRALERLAQHSPEQGGLAEYFSTHPQLDERVGALRERSRTAAAGSTAR